MTTTELKIEGMSCGHCVKAVKEALEGVAGVVSAEVDLDKASATVESSGVAASALIAAVEEEGYHASQS